MKIRQTHMLSEIHTKNEVNHFTLDYIQFFLQSYRDTTVPRATAVINVWLDKGRTKSEPAGVRQKICVAIEKCHSGCTSLKNVINVNRSVQVYVKLYAKILDMKNSFNSLPFTCHMKY